jgi:hypothetical protein
MAEVNVDVSDETVIPRLVLCRGDRGADSTGGCRRPVLRAMPASWLGALRRLTTAEGRVRDGLLAPCTSKQGQGRCQVRFGLIAEQTPRPEVSGRPRTALLR